MHQPWGQKSGRSGWAAHPDDRHQGIALKNSFRLDTEFHLAVDLIGSGRIDVAPRLSDTLPLVEARRACKLTSDKPQSMKVQIASD